MCLMYIFLKPIQLCLSLKRNELVVNCHLFKCVTAKQNGLFMTVFIECPSPLKEITFITGFVTYKWCNFRPCGLILPQFSCHQIEKQMRWNLWSLGRQVCHIRNTNSKWTMDLRLEYCFHEALVPLDSLERHHIIYFKFLKQYLYIYLFVGTCACDVSVCVHVCVSVCTHTACKLENRQAT